MYRKLPLLVFSAVVGVALAATVATAAPSHAPLRVTVDIVAAGHDEVAMPANLAIRAGGMTTIVIRNHTKAFHTFTIRPLGISVLVRPATANGVRATSVTFLAPFGTYEWRCVICASSAHPHMHVMQGKVYAIVNA